VIVRAVILATVLAAACASSAARDADTIRVKTQRYAKLVAAMDERGIASMFASDGEVDVPGRAPVRGPAEIEHFLAGFRNFHVLSEEMTTESVTVSGPAAQSSGTYRQRVRLPQGNVVEVHGTYIASWRRAPAGTNWLLEKISTTPQR